MGELHARQSERNVETDNTSQPFLGYYLNGNIKWEQWRNEIGLEHREDGKPTEVVYDQNSEIHRESYLGSTGS